MSTTATAFAPATVANVAVGFDLLGFALEGIGDRVTVRRIDEPGIVRIEAILGVEGLPLTAKDNTAAAGLLLLCEREKLPFGFEIRIEKGIPVGSGLGGSASSAVAAIVAANALLEWPHEKRALLPYALEGERVASGSLHGDNIAPSLFGGLQLVRSVVPPDVVAVPVPKGVMASVVLPRLRIDTKESRRLLAETLPRSLWIEQSSHLAGTLLALFTGDLALLGRSLHDVVIEPQRATLLTGFHAVKKAALDAGALGCSISGSGPAVFALSDGAESAARVASAMEAAFLSEGVAVFGKWTSPLDARGAELVS